MISGLDIAASSPRVPSPWDDLIRGSTPSTTSASPTPSRLDLSSSPLDVKDPELSLRIPRLAPEIEEGNVEYKLKLLDPTPARFARLVTQLKWRLLEGEGQCYYEIGVADSGLLIGLTKKELERSLETLEEMAGEIGASVVVVKEVEVPDALVQLAQKTVQRLSRKGVLDGLDTDEDYASAESWSSSLGAWDRRSTLDDVAPIADSISPSDGQGSFIPSEDDLSATITLPPKYTALDQDLAFFDIPSDPGSTELDPSDELGLFSFDPEPPLPTSGETPARLLNEFILPLGSDFSNGPNSDDCLSDLSIASVFKPRPSRRRVHIQHHNGTRFDKRQAKWEKQRAAAEGKALVKALPAPIVGIEGPTKADKRRVARDKRREERRLALMSAVEMAHQGGSVPIGDEHAANEKVDQDTADLVHGLEDLHVGMVTPFTCPEGTPSAVTPGIDVPSTAETGEDGDASLKVSSSREPRLIVEALIVRKLSAEEAYGPGNFGFEGFEVVD